MLSWVGEKGWMVLAGWVGQVVYGWLVLVGWDGRFGLVQLALVWFGSLGPGFKGLIVRAVFYRWVGL